MRYLVEFSPKPGSRSCSTPEQIKHQLDVLARSLVSVHFAGEPAAVRVVALPDSFADKSHWCGGCAVARVAVDGGLCGACRSAVRESGGAHG